MVGSSDFDPRKRSDDLMSRGLCDRHHHVYCGDLKVSVLTEGCFGSGAACRL